MSRGWKSMILLAISLLLLAGCGRTLDEMANAGIDAAREAFKLNDKKRTDEIEGVKLYKPAGFSISDSTDGQNIVFTKNDEPYILFINPNEKSDSELFYDLLAADEGKEIIEQATFSDKNVFGFAAVVKSGDERVELITSVGGAKMTTLTKKNKIEENMTSMMEIVRSIKQDY